MKRVGRWLFNLSAGVSVLLCLSTAIAWPVSYLIAPGIQVRIGSTAHIRAELHLGRFFLESSSGFPSQAGEPVIQRWRLAADDFFLEPIFSVGATALSFHGLGFQFLSDGNFSVPIRLLIIPLWFPLIVFAWPLIAWIRNRQRGALPLHHCRICGYDLRATPERCPECGTVTGEGASDNAS